MMSQFIFSNNASTTPAAATPFATGGNICNAVTATATDNVPIIATYSATNTCWNLK